MYQINNTDRLCSQIHSVWHLQRIPSAGVLHREQMLMIVERLKKLCCVSGVSSPWKIFPLSQSSCECHCSKLRIKDEDLDEAVRTIRKSAFCAKVSDLQASVLQALQRPFTVCTSSTPYLPVSFLKATWSHISPLIFRVMHALIWACVTSPLARIIHLAIVFPFQKVLIQRGYYRQCLLLSTFMGKTIRYYIITWDVAEGRSQGEQKHKRWWQKLM